MKENQEKGKTTVRKILDTATEVFAGVGFAGARVDEIANRAGVNKATIYYHIGGKKALYAAVLRDALSGKGAALAEEIDPALSPKEKLRFYIRHMHQAIQAQPLIPSIMLREAASGGKNFPAGVIRDFVAMFSALTDILEEGLAQGVFVRTSPILVHLMIVLPMGVMLKLGPLFHQLPEAAPFATYFEIDTAEEIEKRVLRAVCP